MRRRRRSALNMKPLVGTHCILFHGVSAHRRRRQRKVVRCRNARDRHLVAHQAGHISTLKVVLEIKEGDTCCSRQTEDPQTGRRRCAGRIPASLEDGTRLTCSPHIGRTASSRAILLRRGVIILLSTIADAAATCVGRWLVGLELGEAVPQVHETVRGPGLTNVRIMFL